MRKVLATTAAALAATGVLVAAQGRDPQQVLAEARGAMGGEKLAVLKSLTATGRTIRTVGDRTMENEFELSLELPDKYLMRSVMAAMGNMSVYRNTGFNGGQVIEEIDRPPNLAGGTVMIRIAGPGGAITDPEKMTPEQRAEYDRGRLLQTKKEFTRLALGLFAAVPAAFPLELSYVGQAESPDGKAEVVEVKGEGEFVARLFVDAGTHLPLMLSWTDREPLVIQMGGPGAPLSAAGGGDRVAVAGGAVRVVQGGGAGRGQQGALSKEEREKLEQDLEARRKEAEARRRVVEYRVYYADYQEVGGVRLPHRIQRAVDGRTTEEMIFESFKINPKIDARKFQVTK